MDDILYLIYYDTTMLQVKLPSATRVVQNREGSMVEARESHLSKNSRMQDTVICMKNDVSEKNPHSAMTFEPVVFSFHQVSYEVIEVINFDIS